MTSLAMLACVPLASSAAPLDSPSEAVVRELAPTGTLRAAINYGNVVLAQKDPANGQPRGISVDLARQLARRLGVPIELKTYDAAGKVFDALQTGAWDVAFLAIDPKRAAEIAFTRPYVIIEGTYVVPSGSALRTMEDFDRSGIRIAVATGSAYDLFLTRALKQAQLVRAPTGPDALEMFVVDKLDAAAGVKQALVQFASSRPQLRVIDGRFMVIEQAMGTPKAREGGARYLATFIEEMKRSGFVAEALQRSGQADAAVAP